MTQGFNKAALAAAISLPLYSALVLASADPALTPVVVTANRLAVPADEALAAVTVLERDDIERSQAPDLISLLGRQAGLDVARTGGPGQASTVFLRGSNANHALILVDGVRVNPATQGSVDFAHVPLAQIERIEIVRGPRAALWGSDAIGGIIHIFTRDPSKAFLQLQGGSYGQAGISAGAGVARDASRLGIGAGLEEVDGFSATRPGAFGHDPDHDGYRNKHLSTRAQTLLGSQRLAVSGLLTDAYVQFDQGETTVLNRVFGVSLAGPLSPSWNHELVVGRSSEDLETQTYLSRFGSGRTSLDWTHAVELGSVGNLNVGLNWSREAGYSVEGSSGYEHSRRNVALFASWRRQVGAHLLEASARRDENSQFNGASTGNLAWGWRATDALRLRASWGQGFRAPNFNELYYPGFDVGGGLILFPGNEELSPERSRSLELGLAWRASERQTLDLSVYRTRIKDLIGFDGPLFQAINVRQAAIDGAELSWRLSAGRLALDANATWLNARDQDSGAPLLRRADRKLHVSADYRFDNGAALGLDASALSERADFGGVRLPGYGRVDLRASVPLATDWTAEGRLENLGDRDYQLVDGYNTPGRSVVLKLRWQQQ